MSNGLSARLRQLIVVICIKMSMSKLTEISSSAPWKSRPQVFGS